MATIVERLKYRYKNGDVLVKFLFINITVFFILKVIAIFFSFSTSTGSILSPF